MVKNNHRILWSLMVEARESDDLPLSPPFWAQRGGPQYNEISLSP